MIRYGTQREAFLAEHIARQLLDSLDRGDSPQLGLFSGRAGICLALLEHGVRQGESLFVVAAVRHLYQLIESLEVTDVDASLGSGLAGIAFLVRRAASLVPAHVPEAEQWLATLDDVLKECVSEARPADALDLIVGLAGIGSYACHASASRDADLADTVLQQLEHRASRNELGSYWRDAVPLSQFGSDRASVDLGFAHGIPGIIFCLSRIAQFSSLKDRATTLALDTIRWLRCQTLLSSPTPTFGYWVGNPEQARLAWCYGDVGIACALAEAADIFEDPMIETLAQALADGGLSESRATSLKIGWDVCHGTAGLAVMYARLGRRFRRQTLLDSAQSWRSQMVSSVSEGLERGDFATPQTESVFLDSVNGGTSMDLLNGLAGVLCVLNELNATTSDGADVGKWSDCFIP